MITNETTKNLNLAKHPFGLGNGEYYTVRYDELQAPNKLNDFFMITRLNL
jgi:hypothetical protein